MKKYIALLLGTLSITTVDASFTGSEFRHDKNIGNYRRGEFGAAKNLSEPAKQSLCEKYLRYIHASAAFWAAERALTKRAPFTDSAACLISARDVAKIVAATTLSPFRDIILPILEGKRTWSEHSQYIKSISNNLIDLTPLTPIQDKLLLAARAELDLDAAANSGIYVNMDFVRAQCPAQIKTDIMRKAYGASMKEPSSYVDAQDGLLGVASCGTQWGPLYAI